MMRIFLTVVAFALVLVTGLFFWFAFAFSGLAYYAGLTALLTLALCVALVVYLVHGVTLRILFISVATVVGLAVLATGAKEGYRAYVRSIPEVGEHEVNLFAYQPFIDSSRTAKLGGTPTLRFDTDLPVIDGATALYPLYAAFAEAVYPPGEYDHRHGHVLCRKTAVAYQSLANGEVDVIFAAEPSAKQVAYARERDVEFVLHPIGKEAFVFFVHADNPVEGLSLDQLKGIYSGELRNWKAVGGPSAEIIAYQRPNGSGSQTALIRMMGDMPLREPPADRVAGGMGGMVNRVATYRNYRTALGFTFRFYATDMVGNDLIRLLRVDGAYPDTVSIANGTYPLTSTLYAVTRQRPSANTEKLIQWIQTDQGREIIRKTGYTPIGQ